MYVSYKCCKAVGASKYRAWSTNGIYNPNIACIGMAVHSATIVAPNARVDGLVSGANCEVWWAY